MKLFENKTIVNHVTDWFHDAKWGVFVHFLAQDDWSADEWNRRVDSFDVDAVARQLADVGAGYYFLTTGQNSGHYCVPNETYDSIVGIHPSKLSRRDLIADMADALHPFGIRLMVYHPAGAPDREPVAIERLKWKKSDYGTPGERLAEFQCMWEDIIREWAVRWGDRCAGWWFDGVYHAKAMYLHDNKPNFESFSAAAKAGNPNAIVAFNPGIHVPVKTFAGYEDYTAGEVGTDFPMRDGYNPASRKVETDLRWLNGSQYHILTYPGCWWNREPLRLSKEMIVGYSQYITERDGVITWGVANNERGLIPDATMRQLAAVGKALS